MNKKYSNYIKSKKWKLKRVKFFKSNLFREICFCCKEEGDRFHIHHKNYDRFEEEKIQDLTAVCSGCHSKIHQLHRVGKISLSDCHYILRKYFRKIEKLKGMHGQSIEHSKSSVFVTIRDSINEIRAIEEILFR